MAPTPGVKVKLADGVHTLRFTNRALVRMEDESGLTLAEMGAKLEAGSLKSIAVMLWAGLLHSQPNLTVDRAVDLIPMTRLEDVAGACGEALEKAMTPEGEEPDSGEEGDAENPPA